MRRWLALALLVATSWVHAAGAELSAFAVQRGEDGVSIDYALNFELPRGAEEALAKSVPLYFVAEFHLTRGRWYWLDQTVVSATRERRVSYAPLTEQYRVITSGISQNVTSFEDVRRLLSRVRSWTIAEKGQLKAGERYEAAFRFRLDTSQLPKPFQLNVITSRDWTLASEWYRWGYTP